MENPNFLKQKYDLHNALEVEVAAKRTKVQKGIEAPQNPNDQIQNYLDRLERLALDPNKEQSRKTLGNESRPRALGLLREMVMNEYVRPNKEKMAEGAARVEEEAARVMGIEAHYGEQELEQRGVIAVKDLEKSLDNWILYLSDMNEPYPTWFRYYAFRNVLDMGDFDKDKGEFTKRSKGSTKLFPDIDRGALAFVQERIEAAKDPATLEKLRKAQLANETPVDQLITKEQAETFAKMSFTKQYTEGIRQAGEITPEMREITAGKWVKYQKGTDPTALWVSLQNKGTAWCTKGFATAETQLAGGDFYVYYTNDKTGKPAIPRIAIRMQDENIGEVRGVADNQQNLEGNMAEIAETKMNELPGAELYHKKSADMKLLTAIDNKVKQGQELNKDELTFFYELNSPIEGFGYQRDPRIENLRKERNTEEDMLVIFDCTKEQIAHVPSQINENTKAYVGQLEPGIFQKLPENLEHVYTSFPDKKIRRENLEIGGKTVEKLVRELKRVNIFIGSITRLILESPDFVVSKNVENATFIRLTVADLGITGKATTDKIYQRAEELGLELCPAEVGLHYRLKYQSQPINELLRIGMKSIALSDEDPQSNFQGIFSLANKDGYPFLDVNLVYSDQVLRSDDKFAFRLRHSTKA